MVTGEGEEERQISITNTDWDTLWPQLSIKGEIGKDTTGSLNIRNNIQLGSCGFLQQHPYLIGLKLVATQAYKRKPI